MIIMGRHCVYRRGSTVCSLWVVTVFTGGVRLYASDGSSLCLQEGFDCMMGRHCVYRRGSTVCSLWVVTVFTGGVRLYASDGSSLCLQEGFH